MRGTRILPMAWLSKPAGTGNVCVCILCVRGMKRQGKDEGRLPHLNLLKALLFLCRSLRTGLDQSVLEHAANPAPSPAARGYGRVYHSELGLPSPPPSTTSKLKLDQRRRGFALKPPTGHLPPHLPPPVSIPQNPNSNNPLSPPMYYDNAQSTTKKENVQQIKLQIQNKFLPAR